MEVWQCHDEELYVCWNQDQHFLKKGRISQDTGMSLLQMWTQTTCFVFQETNSVGVHHPVHITMLCYFNSQLQGNVVETDRSCPRKHLLAFSFVMLRQGPWRANFCCKQSICGTNWFYDPLVWENVFRALWLFTEWWLTRHIAPQGKKKLPCQQLCTVSRFLKLHPNVFSPSSEADFEKGGGNICPPSQDWSLHLGYSVTHSEHNRLAINPNFNGIHRSKRGWYFDTCVTLSSTILLLYKQGHK